MFVSLPAYVTHWCSEETEELDLSHLTHVHLLDGCLD